MMLDAVRVAAVVALGASAPAAAPPTLPPQVEALCVVEGGCAWVSQKWLRERMDQVAREAYQAGKRDADIKCGKLT